MVKAMMTLCRHLFPHVCHPKLKWKHFNMTISVFTLRCYTQAYYFIVTVDFVCLADTRDDLYEDVKMSDIIPKMYKSLADKPPGLLQLCLDNKRENIARYLINNGVEMWEDVVVSP